MCHTVPWQYTLAQPTSLWATEVGIATTRSSRKGLASVTLSQIQHSLNWTQDDQEDFQISAYPSQLGYYTECQQIKPGILFPSASSDIAFLPVETCAISIGQHKVGNWPSPSFPISHQIFALITCALPFHLYCFTTKWEKYPQSTPAI